MHHYSRSGTEFNRFNSTQKQWTEEDTLMNMDFKNQNQQKNFKQNQAQQLKRPQYNDNQQSWHKQNELNNLQPQNINRKSNTNVLFSKPPSIDKSQILEIKPEMVIWLDYVRKFQDLERIYKVQVTFQQDVVYIIGNSSQVSDAKKQIQEFANELFIMEYLHKDETNQRDTYTPYLDLFNNEEFIKIKQDCPEITVMTKKKFYDRVRLLEFQGFTGCRNLLNNMPNGFVIIYCMNAGKEKIIRDVKNICDYIKNRIDKNITPGQGLIVDTGCFYQFNQKKYQQSSEKIIIEKMELIWLTKFLNLRKLQLDGRVHLQFQDHGSNDSLILMTVSGSHTRQLDEIIKFIVKDNLQKWKMVLIRHQLKNYDQIMNSELRHFLDRNFIGRDIEIYRGDVIFSVAMAIDQQYQTTVTNYLSNLLSQQQFNNNCLFLLAEKTIIQNMSYNTEIFLSSKDDPIKKIPEYQIAHQEPNNANDNSIITNSTMSSVIFQFSHNSQSEIVSDNLQEPLVSSIIQNQFDPSINRNPKQKNLFHSVESP